MLIGERPPFPQTLLISSGKQEQPIGLLFFYFTQKTRPSLRGLGAGGSPSM